MRAHDRHHPPAHLLSRGREPPERQRPEMPRDHGTVERLGEVFHRPHATGNFSVEIEVVGATDHQHADIGFNHLGELAEGGQWLALAGDIDDQHHRRRGFLHFGDGGANAAAAAVDGFRQHVGKPVAQGGFGRLIVDEGDNWRAVRAR